MEAIEIDDWHFKFTKLVKGGLAGRVIQRKKLPPKSSPWHLIHGHGSIDSENLRYFRTLFHKAGWKNRGKEIAGMGLAGSLWSRSGCCVAWVGSCYSVVSITAICICGAGLVSRRRLGKGRDQKHQAED